MERFLEIARTNLRHNLLPHILVAGIFLLLAPCLMGLSNLDASRTAKVLELYVALIGIILFSPIFLPEQYQDIRELIEAKYTSSITIALIRILESVILLIFMTGVVIFVLYHNHCDFPVLKFYLATLGEAIFLGGMGLCAYRIFDQIAIAYMLPMVYYIINFGSGKKYLKAFYLFSMSYGSYQEKVNLAIAGFLLILIGLVYPSVKERLFPKLIHHH